MLDGGNWCRSFQSLLCIMLCTAPASVAVIHIFHLPFHSFVRSFSLFPFWFGLVSTLSRYTKLQRLFSAYDGSAAGQTDIIECHHAKRAHTICSQQISVQSIILTVFYNFNVSLCSEWFLFCPHSILSVYLLSVFIWVQCVSHVYLFLFDQFRF